MELVTAKEAATILGVNVGTLATWRYTKRYELNYVQVGKSVRYNGTSLHIIGKSLGHKSLTATQIYSRLTDDPVRDSMSEAVKSMRGWSE